MNNRPLLFQKLIDHIQALGMRCTPYHSQAKGYSLATKGMDINFLDSGLFRLKINNEKLNLTFEEISAFLETTYVRNQR